MGAVEPLSQSKKSTANELDVLHICIPVPNKNKFIKIAKGYIEKYQPKLTIINSTVPVGTTVELHKQTGGLIAHSPCLLYTSDAADDLLCVDLGGRRIIK